MKFSTSKEALLRVLGVAQEVINNKSPISILSNVLLQADKKANRVVVKCTNSTVSAVTFFGAQVEEEGETTVFCDKLTGIVSALPQGDIEFESKGTEIFISPSAKKIKFKVKCLATDKFPIVEGFEEKGAFEVAAKDLKEMIRHTIFAVADDPSRYFMSGVYFTKKDEKPVMVATDSRRLSFCSYPETSPDFNSIIIPTKILSIIDKLCNSEGNVSINAAERQFYFKGAGFELSSSLVEAQYPKWEKVIPSGLDKSVTVSKADLEDAIKRTAVMAEKNSRIQLGIDNGKMVISSPESEVGSSKEEIAAECKDISVDIPLNARYLSDVLKAIAAEKVAIDFKLDQENKVSSAIVVRGAGDEGGIYTHIIMPMNN